MSPILTTPRALILMVMHTKFGQNWARRFRDVENMIFYMFSSLVESHVCHHVYIFGTFTPSTRNTLNIQRPIFFVPGNATYDIFKSPRWPIAIYFCPSSWVNNWYIWLLFWNHWSDIGNNDHLVDQNLYLRRVWPPRGWIVLILLATSLKPLVRSW